jgi:hypothetical protein
VLQALALEPPESINAEEYRRRHGLPGSSSLQRALDTLIDDELVAKLKPGSYRISEPFLPAWIAEHGA